jgi:hypothetical protein
MAHAPKFRSRPQVPGFLQIKIEANPFAFSPGRSPALGNALRIQSKEVGQGRKWSKGTGGEMSPLACSLVPDWLYWYWVHSTTQPQGWNHDEVTRTYEIAL